ncbi:MAG TPA: pentapeptide repeat-containing protein [Arsenophonus apicola]|uniref:pentapeptide repeat-containing protein n=1 Tax=Arsenophonus apicola TaxID=2879119 RepID=UPI001CDD1594|nr:pentapeptide repeat-containing protein [Arsenophonus apicola]UBX29616.1 pentapeptide repeat-containing protein [Arsenophonus apicola]
MSSDASLLKKSSDIQSQEHSLLRHANLRRRLFEQLNSQNESGKLSPESCTYFQQQVINHIMPIFTLQIKADKGAEKLAEMMIDQPEWGYLHAGMALLKESGADIKGMSLEEISNNGMLLAALLQEERVSAEYKRYFKIPAMIHEQLNSKDFFTATTLEMTNVYNNYFDYLTQSEQNNPFIKLINLSKNWQSRPELAREQLKAHDISENWLDEYLYHNREVAFINRRGEEPLLPNINKVFADQNQQIAKFTEQAEKILLPIAFNSIRQTEQIFIEQADIQLIKAEFNAIGSYRSYSMGKARLGMAAGGLVTRVPESIDLLKCTLNGEKRIYALTLEQGIGCYKLYRVDEDKLSILGLFGHDGRAYDDDYILKTHPILTLKTTNDKPNILFEKLAKRRSERLYEKLQKEGYQATTRQKVDAFFLSLIPLYTCITEAQNANAGKAIEAGLLDILGFLPFIGKSVQVGSRFSIAMGEAAVNGLRTGLMQTTLRQALRQGGEQFVKFGIPHVMNRVPQKTYINLGVTFLRSTDPGFGLLASGGIKGVNALKNAAKYLQHKIKGLSPLIKALEKKAKDLAVESVKSFKVETAYHPELGKEVQVVNIGQQRGKDIWVRINLENNTLLGRKYLRNSAGELELAPVPIHERLYQLKTQGMGGKGASRAAQRWSMESKQILGSTANVERLNKLKELIVNREANTVINLFNADLSNINFSSYFDKVKVTIDLSLANLSKANLSNSNLYKVNLMKANLDTANLAETNLQYSNLTEASMVGVNLCDAKLNESILIKVDLRSAELTKATLNGVDLTEAKLKSSKLVEAKMIFSKLNNADLSIANLNNAILINADLTHANLVGANLTSADMTAATLTKSNLNDAELKNAILNNADLTKTKLHGAKLIDAQLENANLTEARLVQANLSRANLAGAKLIKANLADSRMVNATLSNADLSNAYLVDAELMNAKLMNANLHEANLTHVKLVEADLTGAKLIKTRLEHAILFKANLNNADLTHAKMQQIDLAAADLSDAVLNGADMREAKLANANLINAQLQGADLTEAKLTEAVLKAADLTDVKLINAELNGANLTRATLIGVDLHGAHLIEVKFNGANMAKADLTDADLTDAELNNVNLTGANLTKVKLGGAKLIKAQLDEANLSNALLIETDLTEARLVKANLHSTVLFKANLTGADLSEAKLIEADLLEADLKNANLTAVKMHRANLSKAQLTNATLTEADLTEVKLNGASLINANLNGVDLTKAELKEVDLTKADLSAATLTEAKLEDTNLTESNLTQAKLNKASMQLVNLTKAELNGAKLCNADLSKAKLTGANMANTKLDEAIFIAAELNNVDLTKASMRLVDLREANLRRAKLNDADLTGAKLRNAKLENTELINTNLSKTDLFQAELSQAKLTEANLYKADLIKATLTKAKLRGAKLNKANLTEVTMDQADLSQADLSNAALYNASLSGVNFSNAVLNNTKLNGAHLVTAILTEADLTNANLTDAKLMYADLTGANLTGTNLTNAILIDAKLNKTKLANTNLTGVKLIGNQLADVQWQGIKLANADLNRVKMYHANLSKADLTNTKLVDTELTAANLTEIKLNKANLSNANLKASKLIRADLQSAKLKNANLTNAILTDANLDGADLSGVTLVGTDIRNVDLSKTTLTQLHIRNTDFTGTVLNDTFTLGLPTNWNDDKLDLMLNHFNNPGSILTSINSIDNAYDKLKTQLVIQLIHSLDQPGINLNRVTLPLLDIIARLPFIKNQQINQFVNKLLDNYLKDYSSELLSALEAHPTIVNSLLNYFEQKPSLMVLPGFHSSFMQTLLAARTQGLDVANAGLACNLYEKYLKLPEIQQQLQYEQIKDIFGDYAGNVDWSDNSAQNYLFLSPTKPGRVLVVAENILSQMLHPNSATKWDNIYRFQDGEYLSFSESNIDKCYNEEFPLFSKYYTYNHHQATFGKLIEALDLGDQLKPLFHDALKNNTFTTKLVDDASQQALSNVFSKVLNFADNSLTSENYSQIMKLYGLTASSEREKAEHLFSLSAVFTRYSSSTIFGTEHHSPLMLRYYAYALMEQAHKCDPTLIGQNLFNDWKARLLGTGDAFTCTALLSDVMIERARERCNEVLKRIQPPAWR